MNIDQVRSFVVVAKHLSLTKASGELHITQPAISRHLKLLSDYSPKPLYERSNCGIRLTPDGRRFLRKAERLLVSAATLREHSNEISKNGTDRFVLASSQGPSGGLAPALIAEFTERHPTVRISLITSSRHHVEKMVQNGKAPLGIVTASTRPASLVAERIREEKLVVFVRRDHPLAGRPKLTWSEIQDLSFVIRGRMKEANRNFKLLKMLESRGVKPNVPLTCDLAHSVKAAVSSQVGAGILDYDLVKSEIEAGTFKELKIPKLNFQSYSYLVYRKGNSLPPEILEFIGITRDWRDRNNHS